ncbi:hypothetical protein LMG28688_04602 [Paraburkholderia caffeinitolerans]|uniref:Uncharacterized protein n=1 Tax=Paraburkholderia caffeinitolerans TaxID=1723730 RepID=A0A6J5GCW3_9BURK|nr:hypothetical protein LMG28688_04602 [Paraburkholderia caffeinitolerans]
MGSTPHGVRARRAIDAPRKCRASRRLDCGQTIMGEADRMAGPHLSLARGIHVDDVTIARRKEYSCRKPVERLFQHLRSKCPDIERIRDRSCPAGGRPTLGVEGAVVDIYCIHSCWRTFLSRCTSWLRISHCRAPLVDRTRGRRRLGTLYLERHAHYKPIIRNHRKLRTGSADWHRPRIGSARSRACKRNRNHSRGGVWQTDVGNRLCGLVFDDPTIDGDVRGCRPATGAARGSARRSSIPA